MKLKRLKRDQGSALVLVLVFVTIFSVIVGSSLLMVSTSSGQLLRSQQNVNLDSASAAATARILGEIENSENLTSGSASTDNCGLSQSTFKIAGVEYIASCTPGADSGVTAALDALVLTGTDGVTGDLAIESATSSIISGPSSPGSTLTIYLDSTAGLRVGDTFVLNTGNNKIDGTYVIEYIKVDANGRNYIQVTIPTKTNTSASSGTITMIPSTQVPGNKFTIESTTAVSFNYKSQKYSIGGLSAKGAINIPESKENPYINVKNASGLWNVDPSSKGKFSLKGNGSVQVPSDRGNGCTPVAGVTYPHCLANTTSSNLSISAANKTYWSQLLRSIEASNGVIARADGGNALNLFSCVAGAGYVELKPGYYDYSDLVKLNKLTSNFTTDSKGKLVLTPLATDGVTPCSAFSPGVRPRIQMNPGTYLFDFSTGAPDGTRLDQLRWLISHDSYNRSFEVKGNSSIGGTYSTAKGKCIYPKDSHRDEYLRLAENRNGIQIQFAGGSSLENHGYFEICPTNYKNRIRTSMVALNTNEALNIGISTVKSAYGSVSGGDVVTITGSGFEPGAQVKIGKHFATNVQVKSSTLITAVTAAHPASKSPENLTVYNSSGRYATFAGAFTYMSTLNSMSPNIGPIAGGTLVTVRGGGFTSPTTITVDNQTATDISVSADGTQITFRTPAHAASKLPVDVVIISGENTYNLGGAFTYAPVINKVTSGQGSAAGGTTIQITGTGFTSNPQVYFETATAANQGTGVSVSGDTITVTTPAHAVGKFNVIVMNSDGQLATFTQGFTFLPVISSIVSAQGSTTGGDLVTITGKGFAAGMIFKFGTRSATGVTCNTSDICTAIVPSGTAGLVDVTGTVNGQSVVFASAYTYVTPNNYSGPSALDPSTSATNTTVITETSTNTSPAPVSGTNAPIISNLSATSGVVAGGNSVIITGNRFDSSSTVFFGSTQATVTGVTSTALTVTVPKRGTNGVAGFVDVTVNSANGLSATLTRGYEYKLTAAMGALTSPATLPATCTSYLWSGGGCTFRITGTGFDSSATVTIGGTAAVVTVESSTALTVTTPAHAAGLVAIVVAQQGSSVTFSNAATYYHSIRSIRGSTGWSGGGDSVVLTGVGFGSSTSSISVTIDGLPATVTNVSAVNSVEDAVTITTPAHAVASNLNVVVTVNGISRTFTGAFSYVSSKGGSTTTKNNTDQTLTPLLTAAPTYNWQNATLSAVTLVTTPGDSKLTTVISGGGLGGSKNFANYLYSYSSDGKLTSDATKSWSSWVSNGTSTTFVISGLTNGTLYNVRVYGTDSGATTSSPMAYSTGTPRTIPNAPAGVVSAIAGISSATISFIPTPDATTSNGGSTITGFRVTSTPGGFTATGTTSPIKVTGLAAGTSYTFTVVAINAAGNSLPSAISNSVTPYTTPGVPIISSKLVDSSQVTLNFTAPVSNGWDTITAYTVNTVATGVSRWDTVTAGSSITISGLSPFTAYTFSLYAVNSAGRSTAATTTATLTAYILGADSTQGPASGGNQVTLTGSGFVSGMTVTVGTTAATGVIVNAAASTITFTVPAGTASATPVDIKVNYNGSSVTYVAAYTYVPVISVISPSKGYAAGGNTITLTGSGLANTTAVRIGNQNATISGRATNTSVSVVVPAGAIGVVDVVATVGSQTATFVGGYAYVPQISSISANKGSAAGGTTMTITGSGFDTGTVVTLGGTTATVTSRTATQLVISTPAHVASATAFDLVVTTNGAPATFARAFTYQAVVSALSSNTYSAAGGQTVTVTGAGFDAGKTTVVIDTSTVAATVTSLNTLTFVVPAHAATGSPLNFVVKVDSSTATLLSAVNYLEVTTKVNTATVATTTAVNTAGAGTGTYTYPGSAAQLSSVAISNPDPLPANSNIRTASTAGEVFVSDAALPIVTDTQTVLYSDQKGAFINGLIFSDAGSFSFYYASSATAKINDGAIVQSLNVEGSPTTETDPVPIQISPTKFAGNRHVWITLREKLTLKVLARIEAVILDNYGWSPASGFEIISVSKG